MGVDGGVAGRLLCLVSLFFWGMEMRVEVREVRKVREMGDGVGREMEMEMGSGGEGGWEVQ